MDRIYSVRCPNCGHLATRSHFISQEAKYSRCHQNKVLKTECDHCDYLMVTCSANASVIEAYSSSTSAMTKEKNNDSRSLSPNGNPLMIPVLAKLLA